MVGYSPPQKSKSIGESPKKHTIFPSKPNFQESEKNTPDIELLSEPNFQESFGEKYTRY